jgi:hypothetical protein
LTVSVEAQSLPAAAAAEAAYVFGYPLVLMERLRVQAPPNRLVHASAPEEEEPDMLCSFAWLDLTEGPVVLSVPDTHGHYYAATLVDMWAGVFASVGPRTTGTGAGAFAVCGPGWTGTPLPPEVKPLAAPTSCVRLSIRTYAGAGAEAARAVQAGFDVRTLREWHRPREIVAAEPGPRDVARADVDALDAASFFAELARLAALHGRGAEIPAGAAALEAGAARGRESVRAAAEKLFERTGGGWELCYAAGRYGDDYARRAGAVYAGVTDRPATDRLIARLRTDADGVPLSGRHRYQLRFEDGFLPPVRAFWSLTANGRPYSSWSTEGGLALERDGALSIRLQSGRFRAAGVPNWLRTPAGAFELVLRLTWPGEDALDRRWSPPPVTREG